MLYNCGSCVISVADYQREARQLPYTIIFQFISSVEIRCQFRVNDSMKFGWPCPKCSPFSNNMQLMFFSLLRVTGTGTGISL